MANQTYEYDFHDKTGMLNKLRDYVKNPDDDNIRIKNKIKNTFLHCPELLYALNDKELSCELFNKDGKLNVDENGEPLGEWDRYFGETALIRPYLFIPESQTEVKNYICYQVNAEELVRYNSCEKYLNVVFSILVNGQNAIDAQTGVPRHDLIASIIREKFSWIGLETPTVPTVNKESVVDNDYIVRTVEFQSILPNNIVKTNNGSTCYSNKRW